MLSIYVFAKKFNGFSILSKFFCINGGKFLKPMAAILKYFNPRCETKINLYQFIYMIGSWKKNETIHDVYISHAMQNIYDIKLEL